SYRILKERLRARQDSAAFIGMDLRDPEIDFVHLAESLGVPARRVTDPADVAPALRAAFTGGGPNLIDVSVADGFGK
ncbi:MAG TPA: thiamine pyrophosphate-dependent enzyme, partial [Bradyrhizobium sp.]|nr:thiamine pyrophosphate-dependent enzyme [Bradyrhizobium sp.]